MPADRFEPRVRKLDPATTPAPAEKWVRRDDIRASGLFGALTSATCRPDRCVGIAYKRALFSPPAYCQAARG